MDELNRFSTHPANNVLNITNAILKPISVVPKNIDLLCKKRESILPDDEPCFFRSSILNLLEEINAISIPEKKAIKTRLVIMY